MSAKCAKVWLVLLLGLSTICISSLVQAQEQEVPSTASKPLVNDKLIACPDCKKDVSKRAVHCPNCGCPGQVIAEEVYKQKMLKMPKSVVKVKTNIGEGYGVALRDSRGRTIVVCDVFMLAGADTLELRDLRDDKVIAYRSIEVANNAPLLCLAVTTKDLTFLPLSTELRGAGGAKQTKPSPFLNATGFKVSSKKNAVVSYSSKNTAYGLFNSDGVELALAPVADTRVVPPAELKQQLNLLSQLNTGSVESASPPAKWLTPYFLQLYKQLSQ